MLSAYFTGQARQDFQRVALLELTGHALEDKHVDDAVVAAYLERWLCNESKISTQSIQLLLDSIVAASEGRGNLQIPAVAIPAEQDGNPVETHTYRGVHGLHSAVIKLLLTALRTPGEKTAYLYSDEPIDWMISHQQFMVQWAYLIKECIAGGMRLVVIHTLSRDSSELAAAVQQWLPFYMTGAVTSYYFPGKRDGLFNHTSFTLEGICTIASTWVRGQDRQDVTYLYITNPDGVHSNKQAFLAQLKLCKPLVRTLTGPEVCSTLDLQSRYFAQGTSRGAGMQCLPLSGMNPELLDRMLLRIGVDSISRGSIREAHRGREAARERHMQHHKFSMIISLPRITDALHGKVPALIPEIITNRTCTYLPTELAEHLQTIIDLIRRHETLEVLILPMKHMVQHLQIFSILDTGMMMFKQRNPKFVFISEQPDLVMAIQTFIDQEAARIPRRERDKQRVIQRLQEYCGRLGATSDKQVTD
jgi:hypothetical protein